MRDALHGMTRFDQFQKSLGIAPNMLTRRLRHLTDGGLLERRRYSERPPRYEYRLTRKGVELWGILVELMKWGNRWAPNDDGPAVVLRHRPCGAVIEPVHSCPACDAQVFPWDLDAVPGPAMTAASGRGAAAS